MVWVCCVCEKDDALCTIEKLLPIGLKGYSIIITIVRGAVAVTQTRAEKHEHDREKRE